MTRNEIENFFKIHDTLLQQEIGSFGEWHEKIKTITPTRAHQLSQQFEKMMTLYYRAKQHAHQQTAFENELENFTAHCLTLNNELKRRKLL